MKNEYFKQLLSDFNEWLRRLNYATSSVKSRTQQLKRFLLWLENKGINQLETVSKKEQIAK